MKSAKYTEGGWEIQLSTGESFRSRYLVTALGALSKAYFPQIAGLYSYTGEKYHTTQVSSSFYLRDLPEIVNC